PHGARAGPGPGGRSGAIGLGSSPRARRGARRGGHAATRRGARGGARRAPPPRRRPAPAAVPGRAARGGRSGGCGGGPVRRLVALALLALAAGRSLAHERSVSYSFWTLTADGAAVEVRLAPGDASRLGEDLDAELPRLLSLAPCLPEPASFHAPPAAPGWIARAWRVRCPRGSGALRIHSDLLLDVVPSHLHFARVGTSGAVAERVLSDGERDWPLPASPAADGAGLGDYVRLGMAALAGVAGRVPPQTLVGLALFAACYFALLARSARPAGLRWPVAALFGLVHGLGFAGVLAEMTLPRARLVPALLGFNVGVE